MDFYKKLATHTIFQVIARIASSGSSFLITIFIARHFGIASYGDYAKVTAYVTMFYLLADFGLNAVFLQKEDNHLRFRDLFYTRTILACLLIIVVNGIAFLLPYNAITSIGFSPLVRLGILVYSITIFTESILFSTFVVFQRRILYHRFMVATVLGSLATLAAVLTVGLLGFTLLAVFFAFLAGAAIEAAAMLVFSGEKLTPFKIDIPFAQTLVFETLPVTVMLVFNLLYFRIDTLLLAGLKPSVDVALYDISYRVFDFLIALPLFLSNVLYPQLISAEKNPRKVKAKYIEYLLVFLGAGALVTVPVWFLGPYVFSLIKPSLAPAIVPLRILLVSLPVFFITNILQWILLAKKQQKFLAIIYALLTILNIVLNLLFIPHYSYVASGIITDIGELLVGVILFARLFSL